MRQHEPLRDEAHVADDRARRFADHLRRQGARVEAFERTDARIRREPRVELAVADVDRDDGLAPRSSSTSVKPPVEAPTSRQASPAGSRAKASSAAASFTPPRET